MLTLHSTFKGKGAFCFTLFWSFRLHLDKVKKVKLDVNGVVNNHDLEKCKYCYFLVTKTFITVHFVIHTSCSHH